MFWRGAGGGDGDGDGSGGERPAQPSRIRGTGLMLLRRKRFASWLSSTNLLVLDERIFSSHSLTVPY